jgi:hypothetical protein
MLLKGNRQSFSRLFVAIGASAAAGLALMLLAA